MIILINFLLKLKITPSQYATLLQKWSQATWITMILHEFTVFFAKGLAMCRSRCANFWVVEHGYTLHHVLKKNSTKQ